MALFNPSLLGPLPNKYEITALCYMTKRIHVFFPGVPAGVLATHLVTQKLFT